MLGLQHGEDVWFQLQLLRAVRVDDDEDDGVTGVVDMQQWDVCYEREVCLYWLYWRYWYRNILFTCSGSCAIRARGALS